MDVVSDFRPQMSNASGWNGGTYKLQSITLTSDFSGQDYLYNPGAKQDKNIYILDILPDHPKLGMTVFTIKIKNVNL